MRSIVTTIRYSSDRSASIQALDELASSVQKSSSTAISVSVWLEGGTRHVQSYKRLTLGSHKLDSSIGEGILVLQYFARPFISNGAFEMLSMTFVPRAARAAPSLRSIPVGRMKLNKSPVNFIH